MFGHELINTEWEAKGGQGRPVMCGSDNIFRVAQAVAHVGTWPALLGASKREQPQPANSQVVGARLGY